MRARWAGLAVALMALVGLGACGDDDGGDGGDSDAPGTDAASPSVDGAAGSVDGGADAGGSACEREPAAADRTRWIVVSHPYLEGGDPSDAWQVLSLSPEGVIAPTRTTFTMGRDTGGRVAFTADGRIGVAVQSDGTLGVFELIDGEVRVIEPAWSADGAFYAADVVMSPDSQRVYVLDSQWRENGGGIYSVALGCDGAPSFEGLLTASKLPYAMAFAGDGRALLVATDVLESTAGADVHLLDWAGPSLIGGTDPFPDDEQIVASSAMTADGAHLLVGDNSQFYSSEDLQNRVAVVRIDGDSIAAVQTLEPIEDPIAIATSPFDDGALVVSGFGDAILRLTYDPRDRGAPFAVAGEVEYDGAPPQLPGSVVLLERGGLRGRVYVAELLGVRQLAFSPGALTDLGLTAVGEGTASIVGAIGVQP